MSLLALIALCLPALAAGTTLNVPYDVPTIEQALLVATAGDTILVAAGTYHESSLAMTEPVVLRGATEDPADVTIDGGEFDTVLRCHWTGGEARIDHITICNGWGELCGGIEVTGGAEVAILNCLFQDNSGGRQPGGGRGGAVGCFDQARVSLTFCQLVDNSAYGGGGVYGEGDTTIRLTDCLLTGNGSVWGGGVELRDQCDCRIVSCTIWGSHSHFEIGAGLTTWSSVPPQVESTIIAFSAPGAAVEGEAFLTDCNLFGNQHGDWVGAIAGQLPIPCNMSADPLFCDAAGGDFTLDAASPCLPGNNGCGVLIGAYGEGCDWTAVRDDQLPSLVITGCRPNPFNPRVTVSFALREAGPVAVDVFDAGGRWVVGLVDEVRGGGEHELVWDGRDAAGGEVPSGLYVVRVVAGSGVAARKVTLLK